MEPGEGIQVQREVVEKVDSDQLSYNSWDKRHPDNDVKKSQM